MNFSFMNAFVHEHTTVRDFFLEKEANQGSVRSDVVSIIHLSLFLTGADPGFS